MATKAVVKKNTVKSDITQQETDNFRDLQDLRMDIKEIKQRLELDQEEENPAITVQKKPCDCRKRSNDQVTPFFIGVTAGIWIAILIIQATVKQRTGRYYFE